MILLASHDDPEAAADFMLCDLEDQLRELGALPAEGLSQFRERMADIAERLKSQAINAPRRPQ